MGRFGQFSLFARRHLRDRDERGVWFALTTLPRREWSLQEIAEIRGLDPLLTARVLEEFEVAGIVTSSADGSGQRRYRLDSEMDYLWDGTVDEFAVDPVCGMPVTGDSRLIAEDDFGRTYRFCSSLCRAAFRAFPNSFTVSPPPGTRTALRA